MKKKIFFSKSYTGLVSIKKDFFNENQSYLKKAQKEYKIYSKQKKRKKCKNCGFKIGRSTFNSHTIDYTVCKRCGHLNGIYEDGDSLWEKVTKVATKIYGASNVTASSKVKKQLFDWENTGFGKYPICVAKTQSSFSTDASVRGAPSDHTVNIREVRLAAGAGFVVMVCGDIMTMPGLPKVPSAEKIDVDEDGKVVGLF